MPKVLLLLVLFPLNSLLAQDSSSKNYEFAFLHLPLSEAINQLVESTQIDLIYPPDLVAGKKAYCRVTSTRIEEVLNCVLKDTGLDFFRLSSGTFILKEAPRKEARFGRLTGQIVDAQTGAPLSDAHIILSDPYTGTATNVAGRFSFSKLLPGSYQLIASHLGYQRTIDSLDIDPDQTTFNKIRLESSPIFSAPVIVNGLDTRAMSSLVSNEEIERSMILNSLPFANANTNQSLSQIIGVQVGNTLSDVHVQGGDIGEHQFRLDGATIFTPVHAGGFLGALSPFALESIELRKAGFGASHGSHLSGLIEAKHFLTNDTKSSREIQIDPLSFNVRMTGNFGSESGPNISWMGAARLGLWNIFQPDRLDEQLTRWSAPDYFLLNAQLTANLAEYFPEVLEDSLDVYSFGYGFDDDQDEVDLSFQDYHGAVRVNFSPTQTLNSSFYRGQTGLSNRQLDQGFFEEDSFGVTSKDQYDWSNSMAQAGYEWVAGDKTFVSVSTWLSQYQLNHPYSILLDSLDVVFLDQAVDFVDTNNIRESGFRTSISHALHPQHFVEAGLELKYTNTNFSLSLPSFLFPNEFPSGSDQLEASLNQSSVFIQDRIELSSKSQLVLGSRLTYLDSKKTIYAEPRLSYQLSSRSDGLGSWIWRSSIGLYRQYLNQFDLSTYHVNALLPQYRFWVPITNTTKPPKSVHLASSIAWSPRENWQLRMESYYKNQPHLLELDLGKFDLFSLDPYTERSIDSLLVSSKGRNYGIGLSAERVSKSGSIRAQYEYSVARRQSPGRFKGLETPLPWNIPNQLRLNFEYRLNDFLLINSRWQMAWGRTWGYRRAYYDFLSDKDALQNAIGRDFSNPEKDTLPAIIRLDAGLALLIPLGANKLQVRLGAMNILSRENISDRGLRADPDTGQFDITERPSFPFMPTLSARMQW